MAEAIARSLGQGRWEVWSAGSRPSGAVHPIAVTLMQELGLSLAGHASKGLEQVPPIRWDYVVTMGCGDACPTVAARHRLDWDIPDPVGRPLEEARRIRDELQARIRDVADRALGATA